MTLETVSTPRAPAAVGPYAQAIKVNGFLYVSGQLPICPKKGEFIGSDARSQTDQCLKNLQAILEEAGSSLNKVVKTTVYLKNMEDFATMNEVYAQFFSEHKPARAAFEVARLPKDAQVEIECVAVL